MIDCVSIENAHMFKGNPLASQHKLRYQSIIKRQGWDVPVVKDMEYDSYDNPATTYLVWRDENNVARGVSRLYPTDRPYMLQEVFSHLVTEELPNDVKIWEGSRFCVDESLSPQMRRRIIQELVLAYLEFGLDQGIERYIGLMYPIYWRNIFTKAGWDIDFMGPEIRLEEDYGHAVRAGGVRVSEENLFKVREKTGIHHPVLNYSDYSDEIEKITKVA
ncbi:MAG: autoinducer synthase [Rhodospirillales bacterium]|nr:autoinducer synthase [Rhodospirillales bacterium]